MRLDFLLDRGELVAQPLVERIDRIHLAIFLKDRRPVVTVLERSGAAPYQQELCIFVNCFEGRPLEQGYPWNGDSRYLLRINVERGGIGQRTGQVGSISICNKFASVT